MKTNQPWRLALGMLLLTFCCGFFVRGQDSLTIRGRVTDHKQHALFLSVVELRSDSGGATQTANTDSSGRFLFTSLRAGRYRLMTSYAGYKPLDTVFELGLETAHTGLQLQLDPSPSMLQSVSVTARRNFMQIENDKKVFYPNAFGGVSSGSAADVMEHVPMVDADKDGNLSIRGKSVNVLINGKPSTFSDIATALQMIPANEIEKVEVMTTPSAKYDADGKGGIVNIVLKKQQAAGWHGLINTDVASQPDEHAGTDLHYRKGKVNVFGKFNGHTRTVRGKRITRQDFSNRDSARYVQQRSDESGYNHDLDAQAGVDYFLSNRTTITALQSWSSRIKRSGIELNLDTGFSALSTRSLPGGYNLTKTSSDALSSGLQVTHHFVKPGQMLSVDLQRNADRTLSDVSLDDPGSSFQQQIGGKNTSRVYTLQADYEVPVGKSGRVETGWKTTLRENEAGLLAQVRSDSGQSVHSDSSLSTFFSYQQAVHALYFTYSGNLGHYTYKAGLRGENAILSGTSLIQHLAVRNQSFRLFPSLFISREFNYGQTLAVSYSTRITRPDFAQLLPYTDLSNPVNRQTGNPDLLPEYSESLELNYSKSFENTGDFIDWAFFYSRTRNSIQQVSHADSNGINITRPQNIPEEHSLGSDVVLRINIAHLVHFNPSIDVRVSRFSEDSGVVAGQTDQWTFSYQMKLEGSIDLPAHLSLLSHGELTGPQILPQGTFRQTRGIDLELKRMFFNRKVTVALIASDIFYDRGERSTLNTPVLVQTERHRENSRQLHLHLSWAF